MSSTKQKFKYLLLAFIMAVTVVFAIPTLVHAEPTGTDTDAQGTIPEDLFIRYNQKDSDGKDLGTIFYGSSDYYLVVEDNGLFTLSYLFNGDVIGDSSVSAESLNDLQTLLNEEAYESVKTTTSVVTNAPVGTLHIVKREDFSEVYTFTDLSKLDNYAGTTEYIETFHIDDEDGKIKVTNQQIDYVYSEVEDDNGAIIGATITCTVDAPFDVVHADPNATVEEYTSENKFVVNVSTTTDVEILVEVITRQNGSIKFYVPLTGITEYNAKISDGEEHEIPDVTTSPEIEFVGIPDNYSVKTGTTVKAIMRVKTPSILTFGEQISDDYVTEMEITLTENDSYVYMAETKGGLKESGVLQILCFANVDEDGNLINPEEAGDDGVDGQPPYWKSRYTNPWGDGISAGETYLVQTGVYEESSNHTMIIIWGIIVVALGCGTVLVYKKGVKKNEK